MVIVGCLYLIVQFLEKKINLIVNKNADYYFNTKDMLNTIDFDGTQVA